MSDVFVSLEKVPLLAHVNLAAKENDLPRRNRLRIASPCSRAVDEIYWETA